MVWRTPTMGKYVVLRRPAARGPGTLSTGSRVRSFDRNATPSLSVTSLSLKEASELGREPETEVVAPVMPTRLIKPTSISAAASSAAWGIEATGADRSPYTGAGVTVAVLDTGIDAAHPAFAGIQLIQRDFTGSGNDDRQGHGTHCAGTIFGQDVGQRIGIARGVRRALIGKVLGDDGAGESEMVFQALTWALEQRADIISMSLGFDFPGLVADLVQKGWPVDLATSNALEAYRSNLRMFDAIMGVLKAQAAFGVRPLVIAASGNESQRRVNPEYRIAASLPAAAQDVLSVAAVGRSGATYEVADFSNSMAVLAAPGVDIVSAEPGGGLVAMSGTSMAGPHVAGLAALWWESIRSAAGKPNALNVQAKLLANVRTDVFSAEVDEADIGQGLATAPI
jgi:subtilisin family serine protease